MSKDGIPSSRSGSAEVADVVQRLDGFDVEAGIARHREALAGCVVLPVALTLEPDAAAAGVQLHDLRRAGIEGERRRKDDADALARAVGEQHRMAHALAVEIDVRLLDHAHVVELGHAHPLFLSRLAAMRMRKAFKRMKPPASAWL